MRVNIGCGQSPTPGWRNFDNSLSLLLDRIPIAPTLLRRMKLLNPQQLAFVGFARTHHLEYANATDRLPLDDESVEVIYSSHMLEHLDQAGASRFLKESLRVLKPGGTLRLVVPDMRLLAKQYLEEGDADELIHKMQVCEPVQASLPSRILRIVLGTRHHQWMYDGPSLCRLLKNQGFDAPQVLPAGQTRIADPAPLDLWERVEESVYVEAVKPLGDRP